MDSDDTFACLPPLHPQYEEFDNESSWFNIFIGEASEDFDPAKLHELVVEYLVFSGYKDAAELLVKDSELPTQSSSTLESTKNIDSLEKRNAIRSYINSGDLNSALKLINEIAPTLLEKNPKLHFKLIRQQLVELIRNKEVEQLLTFAQSNLANKNMAEIPKELFSKLEQTYALLAFDEPENSPFGYLLSLQQRNLLACEVNEAILASLYKPSVSRLEQLFRLMVWNQHQLKTKGDGRKLTNETAEDIAKGIFAREEDTMMNELL